VPSAPPPLAQPGETEQPHGGSRAGTVPGDSAPPTTAERQLRPRCSGSAPHLHPTTSAAGGPCPTAAPRAEHREGQGCGFALVQSRSELGGKAWLAACKPHGFTPQQGRRNSQPHLSLSPLAAKNHQLCPVPRTEYSWYWRRPSQQVPHSIGKAQPIKPGIGLYHRTTEWWGLEGPSVGHLAQPPTEAGSPTAGSNKSALQAPPRPHTKPPDLPPAPGRAGSSPRRSPYRQR